MGWNLGTGILQIFAVKIPEFVRGLEISASVWCEGRTLYGAVQWFLFEVDRSVNESVRIASVRVWCLQQQRQLRNEAYWHCCRRF
jgi:hypothetical protein